MSFEQEKRKSENPPSHELAAEKEQRNRAPSSEAREVKPAVNESAWKSEKAFHVTSDSSDRVTRIEGWLSTRDQERSSQDKNLQDQVRKENGVKPDDKKDVLHLIGYKLGGPDAHGHAKEHGRDNLCIGDERINRSYMGFEKYIAKEIEKGENVFCQVDVHYKEGQKDPSHLTHRYFKETCDGKPVSFYQEFTTKIDERPVQTVNEAVKQFSKESNATQFQNSDSKESQRLYPNA